MSSKEIVEVEQKLRSLERRNTWMWSLAIVLIAGLGVALVSLQLGSDAETPDPYRETRYVLVVGLSGLVTLFSLYMLLKQHQMQGLRSQLFESVLREESMRSRLSGVAELFEGLAQVGVQFELESVLQTVAERIRVSLVADQTSILLIESGSEEMVCAAVSGADADFVRGARVRIGDDIAGWVAQHGEPIVLTPDEIATRFPLVRKHGRNIVSGLCVPLALPDRVIGVLTINRLNEGAQFTKEDARVVNVFAAHIAIAIRRVQERDQAQRVLREQEEQLRQSQKMEALGRLAGGVAHDFNNLLTVVLAYSARLLGHLPAQDPLHPVAEKIVDAAERCASLTRQLLTFSRKQVVELRVLDLNRCVDAMSDLLRRLIGENIQLVTDLDSGLGPVRADESQIEQIVMNLVVNARDALPGAGQILVRTEAVELGEKSPFVRSGARPDVYAVLVVRDTGSGMDDVTRARLFEPFFTTKSKGTGLGLSLVYGIVRQYGGFIDVDSKPGSGTTFRVYIPQADAPLEARRPETAAARPDRGGTILLVEDEDGVRELVREILESHGYRVIEARWAGEAVMLAEGSAEPIDLMITDVVMPGETGGELAQWMARARPGMPVLFMSGYSDDELVRSGVSDRGAVYLQKPFSEDRLLEKVRVLLASADARQRTAA